MKQAVLGVLITMQIIRVRYGEWISMSEWKLIFSSKGV
jgi:hypothetical protein